MRNRGLVALVASALLVAGCAGSDGPPNVEGVDTPTVEVGTSGPERAPSPSPPGTATPPPTPEPTAAGTVQGLPDEGFVVSSDDRVSFVDLEGEVVHELPGVSAALAARFLPPTLPGGPVPLAFPQDGTRWLDPTSGRTASLYTGVPLAVGSSAAPDEDGTRLALRQGGYPLGSWPVDAAWEVSADHDVVTWASCPADERCPGEAVNLRTGDRLTVGEGCWVADVTDAGDRVDVCATAGSDGISWLAVTPAGGGTTSRIGVPRPAGQPDERPTLGRFRRAWWHEGRLLAQLGLECEVPVAVFVDPDRGTVEPVTGGTIGEGSASQALGWTANGLAAVALPDAACAAAAGSPGLYLVDPATGDRRLVHPFTEGERPTVHLWSGPGPGLSGLEARDVEHTFAILRGVDPDAATVTVDPAEWLTGEEAHDAAVADGAIQPSGSLPDDHHVRNPDQATDVLEVAPFADVVLTFREGTGHVPGARTPATLAQVAEHLADVGGAESVWVTTLDGRVVRLAQQYRP